MGADGAASGVCAIGGAGGNGCLFRSGFAAVGGGVDRWFREFWHGPIWVFGRMSARGGAGGAAGRADRLRGGGGGDVRVPRVLSDRAEGGFSLHPRRPRLAGQCVVRGRVLRAARGAGRSGAVAAAGGWCGSAVAAGIGDRGRPRDRSSLRRGYDWPAGGDAVAVVVPLWRPRLFPQWRRGGVHV